MAEINATFEVTPEKIKAFTFNELNLDVSISTTDSEKYWLEAVFEVPYPLSLAPDKNLTAGKILLGILDKDSKKGKKVKIFAANDVYPNTYKVKMTLFIYDKEGVIAERKEYSKELECGEAGAKVLQNP